jgi:hypothetical protein
MITWRGQMPQPYLMFHGSMVPIKLHNYGWQVMNSTLFIHPMSVAKSRNRPSNAPASCSEVYTIAESEIFRDFFLNWMDGSLLLYRGFPGCHFCWPGLLKGKLISEGNADSPSFTMGGEKTRWLPTAYNRDLARIVSVQCLDSYTRGLSLHEHIVIGFTVEIPAGSSRNVPICWLNSGEIVVRGPLYSGQYRMESITWLRNELPSFTRWPPGFTNLFLPPQRPFQPRSALAVYEWWDTCQDWKAEARRLIPGLQ